MISVFLQLFFISNNRFPFLQVPVDLMNLIVSNVTILQEVLAYHVVPGTQCSAGLMSGGVATVNGADIEVTISCY